MKHFDVTSGSTPAADAGDTPAAPAAVEAATAAAAFKPAARRPDRDNLLSSAIACSCNSDLLAEDVDAGAAGEGRCSSKVFGGGGVARKAADNITCEEAIIAAVVHSPSLMLSAAVHFGCTGSYSTAAAAYRAAQLSLLLSGRNYSTAACLPFDDLAIERTHTPFQQAGIPTTSVSDAFSRVALSLSCSLALSLLPPSRPDLTVPRMFRRSIAPS